MIRRSGYVWRTLLAAAALTFFGAASALAQSAPPQGATRGLNAPYAPAPAREAQSTAPVQSQATAKAEAEAARLARVLVDEQRALAAREQERLYRELAAQEKSASTRETLVDLASRDNTKGAIARSSARETPRPSLSRDFGATAATDAVGGYGLDQSAARVSQEATAFAGNIFAPTILRSVAPGRFVFSAKFFPGGAAFLTTSQDGWLNVWETATGKPLLQTQVGRDYDYLLAAISPDGGRIATGSDNGILKIWTPADASASAAGAGAWTAGVIGPREFKSEKGQLTALAFSPSGDRIASGHQSGAVIVWDVATGRKVQDVKHGNSLMESVSFSPDSKTLITAAEDTKTHLWDLATGQETLTLEGHGAAVTTALFSKGGKHIVTTSNDRKALIWDASTGRQLYRLSGHTGQIWQGEYSADGARIVTASTDGTARIWDAATGMQVAVIKSGQQEVRTASFSPDGKTIVTGSYDGTATLWSAPIDPTPLFNAMDKRPFSTAEVASWIRAAKSSAGQPLDAAVTDETIARQVAAYAFKAGRGLNLIDAPWKPAMDATSVRRALRDHRIGEAAPLIAAGAFAIGGLILWLWRGLRRRSFLERRRPEESGRIVDLFSDERRQSQQANQAVRKAARRLLEREEGHASFDAAASVAATARAGGLFTPVTRARRRLPEYLFLIDSRSRSDHEAKRALDYVTALKKEAVPVERYFFERTPDRVRHNIGQPTQPLSSLIANHGHRRLVIVGDPAAMLEPNRLALGSWAKSLNVWTKRAVLTTVSSREWGAEERAVAAFAGAPVGALSTAGLASLPETLKLGDEPAHLRLTEAGDLAAPPLPPILREDSERWLFDRAPDAATLERLHEELTQYLGLHGWRWLCACAIYPAVDWDLTVSLGMRLKRHDGEPLFEEARAAKIAQLPWMKAGQMPDWLRAHLIAELSPEDEKIIRAFLAEVLDAARKNTQRDGQLNLRFSVGETKERTPFKDDVFVKFLQRQPEASDRKAMAVSRTLRRLLGQSLWTRLFDRNEVAWPLAAFILAGAAYMVAPRTGAQPAHTGAWLGLLALLFFPLALWLVVWAVRNAQRTFIAGLRSAGAAVRNPLGAGRKAVQALSKEKFALWRRFNTEMVYGRAAEASGITRELGFSLPAAARRMFVSATMMLGMIAGVFVSFSIGILIASALGLLNFAGTSLISASPLAGLQDIPFGDWIAIAILLAIVAAVAYCAIVAGPRLARRIVVWRANRAAGDMAEMRLPLGQIDDMPVARMWGLLAAAIVAMGLLLGGSWNFYQLASTFTRGFGLLVYLLALFSGCAYFLMRALSRAELRRAAGLPVRFKRARVYLLDSGPLAKRLKRALRKLGVKSIRADAANPSRALWPAIYWSEKGEQRARTWPLKRRLSALSLTDLNRKADDEEIQSFIRDAAPAIEASITLDQWRKPKLLQRLKIGDSISKDTIQFGAISPRWDKVLVGTGHEIALHEFVPSIRRAFETLELKAVSWRTIPLRLNPGDLPDIEFAEFSENGSRIVLFDEGVRRDLSAETVDFTYANLLSSRRVPRAKHGFNGDTIGGTASQLRANTAGQPLKIADALSDRQIATKRRANTSAIKASRFSADGVRLLILTEKNQLEIWGNSHARRARSWRGKLASAPQAAETESSEGPVAAMEAEA